MLKNFRDKIALSGVTVLLIGVALLIFTFLSAYGFLTQSLSIIASEDLVRTFGEALAPLVATCIRIMYLGVMGWIGSLLTIRGVTIIAHAPETPKVIRQKPKIAKPIPTKAKTEKPKEKAKPPEPRAERPKTEKPEEEVKPEEKVEPSEPEVIFIPPEPASQPPPPQKQEQENESSQQPYNSY